MRRLLIVATALCISTTAQADIICTLTGCWETGKKIVRHGGVYRGLEYKKFGQPQRVTGETSDAFAPRAK